MSLVIKPRRTPKLDYRLCNQTITIFNLLEKDKIKRTVIKNGVFMSFGRQWTEGTKGTTGISKCTIVIPQGADGKVFVPRYMLQKSETTEYTLFRGDKVVLGEYPEVSIDNWIDITSSKIGSVATISRVTPQFLNNELVHIEAGD